MAWKAYKRHIKDLNRYRYVVTIDHMIDHDIYVSSGERPNITEQLIWCYDQGLVRGVDFFVNDSGRSFAFQQKMNQVAFILAWG